MKFTTITLLFAATALASPAPAAQPDSLAVPAPVAAPINIDTRAQSGEALAARVEAPDAGNLLATRDPKKSKPKGSSNSSGSAADTITPSRALQLSALGLGVMEIARLWA
jgi:hypothetical protein